MTREEFDAWFERHKEAYPGITAWIRKAPGQMNRWFKALQEFPVHLADRATDEMFSGGIDEPQGFSKHPRAIADFCRKYTKKERSKIMPRTMVIDGQPVYNCRLCLDEGLRDIYRPHTERCLLGEKVQVGNRWTSNHYTCVCACTCEVGRERAKNLRLPLFDERVMIEARLHEGLPSERNRVALWLKDKKRHQAQELDMGYGNDPTGLDPSGLDDVPF